MIRARRTGTALAVLFLTGAYLLTLLVLLTRNSLGGEFFFDEAWRSDLIRSDSLLERYADNIAPIPLAWLSLMRLASTVAPDGFRGLRLTSLALATPGLVAMVAIVHECFRERWGSLSAWLYGVSATTLLLLAPGVHQVAAYLNDYVFQAGWTALFVLAWIRLARHDGVVEARAFSITVVLLPLGTISGAFLLPVALVDLAHRIRSGRTTALRMTQLVVAFGSSAVVTAVLALRLYLPLIDDSLASFWATTSLRQAGWDAVAALPQRIWATTLVRETFLFGGGIRFSLLAMLAVSALAVVGYVAFARHWPAYPAATLGAMAVTALVSLGADWPLTPERVNLPLWWMAWLAVGVGSITVLHAAVRRPPLVIAAVVVIAAALFPVSHPSRTQPFAVGLYADLAHVRGSPATQNIVLSFHPMSHFYAHDALVNESTDGRNFTIVADLDVPSRLLDDPEGAVLDAGWEPGSVIWCIVPYELGEDSTRACRLDEEGFVQGTDHHGERARITSWSAAAP